MPLWSLLPPRRNRTSALSYNRTGYNCCPGRTANDQCLSSNGWSSKKSLVGRIKDQVRRACCDGRDVTWSRRRGGVCAVDLIRGMNRTTEQGWGMGVSFHEHDERRGLSARKEDGHLQSISKAVPGSVSVIDEPAFLPSAFLCLLNWNLQCSFFFLDSLLNFVFWE